MLLLKEIKTHKFRAVKTAVLYLVFATMAVVLRIRGPSLFDLTVATGATFEEITYTIPIAVCTSFLSSTCFALVVKRVDVQILLICASVVASLATAVYPFSRSLFAIYTVTAVIGIANGFIIPGSNLWLFHMWGKSNAPFMQGLHCSHGVGAFIAPLLASPFLLPTVSQEEGDNGNEKNNLDGNKTVKYTPDDLSIQYPYLLTAGFYLCICVLFTMIYIAKPSNKEHPTRQNALKEVSSREGKNLKVKLIVALVVITVFFYFSIELCFGQFLMAYAVKGQLQVPKKTGAYLMSMFWCTFTVARFFTIFVVDLIGTQNLILLNLSLISTSTLIFVPFSQSNEVYLWLSTALMGCGLSSTFPTLYGLVEEVTTVSGALTSIIFGAGGVGSFVVSYLVGHFIKSNINIFPLITLSCCITITGLSLLILFLKQRLQVHLEVHQTEPLAIKQ